MILSIRLQIIDIKRGQTRHKQLNFLFVEDRDETLRNDVIEAVEETVQLLTDGACGNMKLDEDGIINIYKRNNVDDTRT